MLLPPTSSRGSAFRPAIASARQRSVLSKPGIALPLAQAVAPKEVANPIHANRDRAITALLSERAAPVVKRLRRDHSLELPYATFCFAHEPSTKNPVCLNGLAHEMHSTENA
jgi:hypothetical protein